MRRTTVTDLPPAPPGRSGWPWTAPLDRLPGYEGPSTAWPRVTVVTPSFNQAEFIEATVRSVLLQGYPNLEYMIVDGGSDDGTVDIIRKYQSHLAYWVSERDRGQADAINKGWRRATGDVIAYLNSDDLYLPKAVASSVAHLERTGADLLYASAHRIDRYGRVFERVQPPAFDLEWFVRTCFMRQPTVFFRRRLLDELGYLDESLQYCLDYEYWLRATRLTIPVRLSVYTAADRFHSEAKSGSQLHRTFREEVTVLDRLFRDGTLPSDNAALVRGAYLPRLIFLAGERSGLAAGEREEMIDRLCALQPSPSFQEVTAVVAGHDNYRASPYLSHAVDARDDQADRQGADAYGIVPALLEAGLTSQRTAERVLRRARVHSAIRRLVHLETQPVSTRKFLKMARVVAQNPWLLRSRAWWVMIARSSSMGGVAVSLYYTLRDLQESVKLAWRKIRRIVRDAGNTVRVRILQREGQGRRASRP